MSLTNITHAQLLQFTKAWLQPCLGDHISIVMQLGFLVVFLLHLASKIVTLTTKRGTMIKDVQGPDKLATRVRFSIASKLSIVCSLMLTGTHILAILFLQNRGMTYCMGNAQALVSEILQVILWAASSIGVHYLVKNMFTKFHWLLKAWWFLSLILSIICVAIDTHLRFINHGKLRLQDYANFIGLLLCTCLFGISIKGKMGIVVHVPSSITDPLLNGKSSKIQRENKRASLYGKSTILQLVTFSWLNPLFSVGYKRPLEEDEIPDVDIKDSASFLSSSFNDCLMYFKEKDGVAHPSSIYWAICALVWKKIAINGCFAVVSASASYVGPYLINDFISFLSEKKTRSLQRGYFLALSFLGAKMIETTAQRQWIFGARQLALRLRAALISHTYKKGLVLSSQSRQSRTSGEIINYMSVDIQRITDFMWYINMIWMLPIQISFAIYILHTNLDLGYLAALAATVLVLACNIPLTRIQKKYQSKIMEMKDNRMKSTSEILRNMKILKLQAWDAHFFDRLEALRKLEYGWLLKSVRLAAIIAFIFWGSPTFISVVTFGSCTLMGIELTTGRVLAALATLGMLQDPIFNFPDLLNVIAQGKVSADRIASILQEDEIQPGAIEYIPKDQTEFDIEVQNGTFSWDGADLEIPTLDGINIKVKRGMKVAICGTVGSGKSSLLSCLLGEMQKLSGTVKICGTKAYVPQSPWIQSGIIRENILFGNEYDCAKYGRTVKACALAKDFELFGSGDLTEIGERGINMSGGQKQRIQIARAVYQDADIYLLDDPFSAVDAHTGTQLFDECLMGILKEKTILFVTHQVEFLPAADLILVMQNGKIAQAGTFENLLKEKTGFEMLVGAHNVALESLLTMKNTSTTQQILKSESIACSTIDYEPVHMRHESNDDISVETIEEEGRLLEDEEREKGSIGKEIYWNYLTTVKGGFIILFIIFSQLSFQVLQIGSNYWMAWSCSPATGIEPKMEINFILFVYVMLAIGGSLCVLLRTTLVGITGLWTAQKLFINMLSNVFRAPMAFFDSTPAGRILSRVSTDQSVIDMEMSRKLDRCAFSIIQILGTILVMSQVAWEVFVIFIPVTAVCIWYQQYYIPTARELARLEGIQRTPILNHFAESLSGSSTIRAFQQEARFIDSNLILIDNLSMPAFHNMAAMEWLSFRLNILSALVFAFSLVLLVTLPEGIINPSIAGLAVTYGMNLNIFQASVIWNICDVENKMISVERVIQYSNIASEAPLTIEDCKLPSNWPQFGTICFRNLQIRYAVHLPSVLNNITCTFPGKKKIGVVGRTGSGKSTLIQAIFRIVEPREGSIIIDDVDISRIGLHDLRSKLSIIPQDPTMLQGTVRGNLDPLEQYTDFEAWKALEKCQLASLVREKEKKLDSIVVENGENWSVGQRQLFCLGRALLKKSSILILDEATASVDSTTDGIIQRIIREEFKDRTVVTIAHRIHTIVESDLVLVLSDGRVAEYDTPANLLEKQDSFFAKLVKEYSTKSKSVNVNNLHNHY